MGVHLAGMHLTGVHLTVHLVGWVLLILIFENLVLFLTVPMLRRKKPVLLAN